MARKGGELWPMLRPPCRWPLRLNGPLSICRVKVGQKLKSLVEGVRQIFSTLKTMNPQIIVDVRALWRFHPGG